MPVLERGDVRIDYEVQGEGFPVLLVAPGGMRSAGALWGRAPWNPVEALRGEYQVITMDQRNAGASTAPIRADDGWPRYTEDQLALADHLGLERFAVIGMCIGGPHVIRLCRAAPERVRAAVLLQPIGEQGNRRAFLDLFDAWAEDLRERHPEVEPEAWATFRARMFGGDFMFGASRRDVASCAMPLLVLMGDDLYHPASISRAVVELAPRATLVERWKEGDDLAAADETIRAFLRAHAA